MVVHSLLANLQNRWNVFECVVLILTIVLIVMFFYKYLVAYNLSEEISENPKKFHNLQYAAYWDEVCSRSVLKGPPYVLFY